MKLLAGTINYKARLSTCKIQVITTTTTTGSHPHCLLVWTNAVLSSIHPIHDYGITGTPKATQKSVNIPLLAQKKTQVLQGCSWLAAGHTREARIGPSTKCDPTALAVDWFYAKPFKLMSRYTQWPGAHRQRAMTEGIRADDITYDPNTSVTVQLTISFGRIALQVRSSDLSRRTPLCLRLHVDDEKFYL